MSDTLHCSTCLRPFTVHTTRGQAPLQYHYAAVKQRNYFLALLDELAGKGKLQPFLTQAVANMIPSQSSTTTKVVKVFFYQPQTTHIMKLAILTRLAIIMFLQWLILGGQGLGRGLLIQGASPVCLSKRKKKFWLLFFFYHAGANGPSSSFLSSSWMWKKPFDQSKERRKVPCNFQERGSLKGTQCDTYSTADVIKAG